MNRVQIEGNWEQLKGLIHAAWGHLTDDEVALYNGKLEQFYGKVKQRYGIAREEADKRLKQLQKEHSEHERDAQKAA